MAAKDKNDKHKASEFTALKNKLKTKHGLSNTQCDSLIGITAGDKARGQIADDLIAWLRTRPKGS